MLFSPPRPQSPEPCSRRAEKRPDVIYHLGDWGKEPMALIFGREAREVVERVKVLLSPSP
ncbi:thiamine-phosphate synthase family protein [Thermococcus sp. 18S1]|uniref:thiamine-phosphate synthase family protein n=1 Tax=Thermococcus sp. 18S1 TaxID=1638210 RepID=UPI0037443050